MLSSVSSVSASVLLIQLCSSWFVLDCRLFIIGSWSNPYIALRPDPSIHGSFPPSWKKNCSQFLTFSLNAWTKLFMRAAYWCYLIWLAKCCCCWLSEYKLTDLNHHTLIFNVHHNLSSCAQALLLHKSCFYCPEHISFSWSDTYCPEHINFYCCYYWSDELLLLIFWLESPSTHTHMLLITDAFKLYLLSYNFWCTCCSCSHLHMWLLPLHW